MAIRSSLFKDRYNWKIKQKVLNFINKLVVKILSYIVEGFIFGNINNLLNIFY